MAYFNFDDDPIVWLMIEKFIEHNLSKLNFLLRPNHLKSYPSRRSSPYNMTYTYTRKFNPYGLERIALRVKEAQRNGDFLNCEVRSITLNPSDRNVVTHLNEGTALVPTLEFILVLIKY